MKNIKYIDDFVCINTRNSKCKIAYVRENFGPEAIKELFRGVLEPDTFISSKYFYRKKALNLDFFLDEANWYCNEINLILFNNLKRLRIDLLQLGKFTIDSDSKANNVLVLAYFQLLGPISTMVKANEVNRLYNRTKNVNVFKLSDTSATVRLNYLPGYSHSEEVTMYNIGCYLGIMERFIKIDNGSAKYRILKDEFDESNGFTEIAFNWTSNINTWSLVKWTWGLLTSRLVGKTYLSSHHSLRMHHEHIVNAFESELAIKDKLKSENDNYYRQLIEEKTNRQHELEHIVAIKTKELASLLEQKELMFENISHEFRTPLTIILGNIDSISSDNIEKTKSVLEDQSNRLLRLVDNLLALAEIRAFKTEYEVIDIERKAHLLIESFKSLSDSRNLHLQLLTDLEYSHVRIPKDALELVMNNIVGNAIKYAISETEIRVTLCLIGNTLRINVINQSHEIDTESAIQRFNHGQLGSLVSSGIGLDIVNELAQKLGGQFQIAQQEASVICDFTLPIERTSLAPDSELIDDATIVPKRTSMICGKVMIVEDNLELSNFLRDILSVQFEVVSLENGALALDYLHSTENLPELIISDVMMPLMGGFELCAKVKADRLLGSIPFILLTAKGDTQSQREGYTAKADDYIVKPFDKANLFAKVVNLVETLQKAKAEAISALYTSSLNTDDEFTLKFQSVLAQEFSNPELDIAFVADALNTSTKTLNRRLSGRFGKTFSEVLKCYRIEKSVAMLHSGRAIKEIAFDCGFSSQSYFSQCFKQVMGMSPQDFINSRK